MFWQRKRGGMAGSREFIVVNVYLARGLIWLDAGCLHLCSWGSKAGARVSTRDCVAFSPCKLPEACSNNRRMPSRFAAASPPLRLPEPLAACICEDERCRFQGWLGLVACPAGVGLLIKSESSSTTWARPWDGIH